MDFKNFSATATVALGGLAGALLRWGVEETLSQGVLIVNTIGSALLGIVVAAWLNQADSARHEKLLNALVGFCGSFTTFSAIAFAAAQHIDEGEFARGVGSLLLQFALGLPAAWFGFWVMRRWKAA